jgi:hypothetical protein
MTNEEKRRILDEARRNCERLASLSDRNETPPREDTGPNRLDRWREGVRQREVEFARARAQRQAEADAETQNTQAWRLWVVEKIDAATFEASRAIAEAVSEQLSAVGDALARSNSRADKLERELTALSVAHCKLEVRYLKGVVDDDRSRVVDLPNPLPPVRRH